MTLAILAIYLAAVLAVGMFSHRLFRGTGEDYFLATRSIGPFVLLMSLFGTHMTSFSLLGASGEGYRSGVGVFSLMASSSAIVAPLIFYFIGIRLWALGKRHGFVTQVQFFRERWDSPTLGVLLFVVLVALLIPYLLIGVMGAGMTVSAISEQAVPGWAGSLAACLVVLCYVTFGGLRGTAWANTFQTLVFMTLGALTFVWILSQVGGLEAALARVAEQRPEQLVRGERIPPAKFVTYALLPLSVGMFPHIFMHWLTARKAETVSTTDDRLPAVHRHRLGTQRATRRDRFGRSARAGGAGREQRSGAVDSAARAGDVGRHARCRGLCGDHVVVGLAGALAGHDVHPRRLATPCHHRPGSRRSRKQA